MYRRALILLLGLIAPDTALALDCADDTDCPEFFACGEDSRCVELNIECGEGCPGHLSCQPTTTEGNVQGEPAPAGFLCAWVDRQCQETACEHAGFECVACDSPSGLPCQHCVPSRIACETHADCPEFFYCFSFTEEEVPEYWPPGAGRACKPLLGPHPYKPRELDSGELQAPGGADAGPTSTNMTNGDSTTSSDPAPTTHGSASGGAGTIPTESSSTASASTSGKTNPAPTTHGSASGGAGTIPTESSSTAFASTSGKTNTDAVSGTRTSEGCNCSVVGSGPRGVRAMQWALLAGCVARRRKQHCAGAASWSCCGAGVAR